MDFPGAAPPQLSPDGRWWWNGSEWVSRGYWPAPPASADGLAIGALVTSILWLGGLGSVAGVVMGHVSRNKARSAGREPSGVSLAALVVGYLGLALALLLLVFVIAVPLVLLHSLGTSEVKGTFDLLTLSAAEDSYFQEHQTYTARIDDLPDFPLPDPGSVQILSASTTTYCLRSHRPGAPVQYYTPAAGLTDKPCS